MAQESNLGTDISIILGQLRDGDDAARQRLFDLVYDQLYRMACGQMRNERVGHTLGASALVSEAFLRISGDLASRQDRRALFGAAAMAMRRILIDHARKRKADIRPWKLNRQPLDDMVEGVEENLRCEIGDLNDALEQLGNDSPRQREVVELKFFAGQTIAEIASHLDCSPSTVESDWRLARAKLFRLLSDEG